MGEQNRTIQRILAAATEIFSEVGFSGARMDAIANRAGVNKATIYYNIGNKKNLYERVLQAIFDDRVESLINEMQSVSTPDEKLLFFIRAMAGRIDEKPYIPNLIMWEHASGGKNLSEEFAGEVVRVINVLTEILQEGEQTGRFRKTDPFLLHSMIIGSFFFYKTSIPIRNGIAAFPRALKNYPAELSGKVADAVGEYVLGMVRNTGAWPHGKGD